MMVAPFVVGGPVWGYGDPGSPGTVLRVAEDPHEYMPGLWLRVRWYDGFVCWTTADHCSVPDLSFT